MTNAFPDDVKISVIAFSWFRRPFYPLFPAQQSAATAVVSRPKSWWTLFSKRGGKRVGIVRTAFYGAWRRRDKKSLQRWNRLGFNFISFKLVPPIIWVNFFLQLLISHLVSTRTNTFTLELFQADFASLWGWRNKQIQMTSKQMNPSAKIVFELVYFFVINSN